MSYLYYKENGIKKKNSNKSSRKTLQAKNLTLKLNL